MNDPVVEETVPLEGVDDTGMGIWRVKCRVCQAHSSEIRRDEVMLWILKGHTHYSAKVLDDEPG